MSDHSSSGRDRSFIGKCEVLFCVLPAEETVYSPAYEREIAVCEECHAERTGEKEIDKSSKRYQLGEFARRSFDTDNDRDGGRSA